MNDNAVPENVLRTKAIRVKQIYIRSYIFTHKL